MVDLDAIKERLAAATPGPWRAEQARTLLHITSERSGGSVVSISVSPPRIPEREMRDGHVRRNRANANLIANAPTDIAALVAEVERLRATMTEIAERFRVDLWVNDDDFRGHEYYELILDALAEGEVSGG